MTVIFECSGPFQTKPGRFKNHIITRVWWLWFAVSILHVPFKEFCETPYEWAE